MFPKLIAAIAMIATGLAQADTHFRITDLEDLDWRIVNDTVMGGRSNSRFDLASGQLSFSGELNTNGGGFASVRSAPQDWALSTYDRIRLRVRGDGRTYQIRLSTNDSRATFRSRHVFTDQWQVIEAEFSDFQATWRGRILDLPPPEPAAISGVGLMLADGRDGPFRIQVDWIEFATGER